MNFSGTEKEIEVMIKRTGQVVSIVLIFALTAVSLFAQNRKYNMSEGDMKKLVSRIQDRTQKMRDTFNNEKSQDSLKVFWRRNRLNGYLQDLQDKTYNLSTNLEQRRVSSNDAQEVLNKANKVEEELRKNGNSYSSNLRDDWSRLSSEIDKLARAFYLSWNGGSYNGGYGNQYPNNYPNNGGYNYNNNLTGTYNIDFNKSDNVQEAAMRATKDLGYNREQVRQELLQRLEAPDRIAIDLRGRTVTIASTKATQVTFEADGRERSEQLYDGSWVRVRATLDGEEKLTVTMTGDRDNDYQITFDSNDNGRRMKITRKVWSSALRDSVTTKSVYDKISDVAQLDINNNYPGNNYPNYPRPTTNNGYLIADNVSIVATLNDDLSTKTVQDGQRFTMTVQSPSQYRGAILEGYVSGVDRSGRVKGRSQMTFNFETIRYYNSTYRFAGTVEEVRDANGNKVKVDEGSVKDDSRGKTTIKRAGIGAGIGAVVGAIVGGAKGAAIGAAIGAGAGAGTVFIQGRDDLDLRSGSEMTIRSSAPSGYSFRR
jgi:hypothetical protein